MVICDGCQNAYHMNCIRPPLTEMPQSVWLCPKCVVRYYDYNLKWIYFLKQLSFSISNFERNQKIIRRLQTPRAVKLCPNFWWNNVFEMIYLFLIIVIFLNRTLSDFLAQRRKRYSKISNSRLYSTGILYILYLFCFVFVEILILLSVYFMILELFLWLKFCIFCVELLILFPYNIC